MLAMRMAGLRKSDDKFGATKPEREKRESSQ